MSSTCRRKLAGSAASGPTAGNGAFTRIRAQRSLCTWPGAGAAAWGGRGPGGHARCLWRHELGTFPPGLSLSVSLVGPRLQPESRHTLLGASGPPRAASPRSGSRRGRASCDLDSCVWHVRPPRRCVGFSPGENLGGDDDLLRGGLSVLHRRTKALSVSPGWFNQMSLNM